MRLLQLMRRFKLAILVLLIIIAIGFIILFYLQIYVQMDPRLRKISNIDTTKIDINKTILYVDKLVAITERLKHFSVSRVSLKKSSTNSHCNPPPSKQKQSLLIISASSRDLPSIYTRFLRQLQACFNGCNVPQVYILKRLRPLIFNNAENINKYTFEIGEAIQYLTTEAEREISIFTHEEGALLMLNYFAKCPMNFLQASMIQKIRTILIVDMVHPLIRIEHDPPFRFITKIKKEIVKSKQRFALFNKLKIIIINTQKEDNNQNQYQFAYGQQHSIFTKTVFVSSREMANVHSFLFPNPLSFSPFIARIGNFLAIDFLRNMSTTQITALLKHGQGYIKEAMNSQKVRQCERLSIIQNSLVTSTDYCFMLGPMKLTENQVILIYAGYNFEVYADTLQRIFPFEELQQGSLYVFEKLESKLHILNPESINIYIFKQNISSHHPIASNSNISLLVSNFTIVRLCLNTIVAIPLHTNQDNLRQSHTLDGNNCFVELDFFKQFSLQFFFHWGLFRNILIFTLLCSQITELHVSNRVLDQFLFIYLFLMFQDNVVNKLINSLCILSISLLLQYSLKAILYICSSLTLKQKWASFAIEAISAICLLGYYFNTFNYWKIFLLSIIFFITEENITLLIIKLFFVDFEVLYNATQFSDLSNLCLMTMWLYTTLVIRDYEIVICRKWPVIRILGIVFLLAMAQNVDSSGPVMEKIITIYMKIMVLIRMVHIMKK